MTREEALKSLQQTRENRRAAGIEAWTAPQISEEEQRRRYEYDIADGERRLAAASAPSDFNGEVERQLALNAKRQLQSMKNTAKEKAYTSAKSAAGKLTGKGSFPALPSAPAATTKARAARQELEGLEAGISAMQAAVSAPPDPTAAAADPALYSAYQKTLNDYGSAVAQYNSAAGRYRDYVTNARKEAQEYRQQAKKVQEKYDETQQWLMKIRGGKGAAYSPNSKQAQYLEQRSAGYAKKIAQLEKLAREAEEDYYSSILLRDDYAQKSGKDRSHAREDGIYSYINDTEENRRRTVDMAIGTGSDDKGYMYAQTRSLGYLTDEERGIYNYIYTTEGKEAAADFLATLGEALAYREGAQRYGQLSGTEKALYWIPAGLEQFFGGAGNTASMILGRETTTSPIQYTSGMVRQEAQELSPVLGVAYDVGTSAANMAPSVLMSFALGGLGAPAKLASAAGDTMVGVSAAGNAYNEALKSGYTKSQARVYATLSGASEALLQYALGGIEGLGGIDGDKVLAKIAGMDNAIGRLASSKTGSLVGKMLVEMTSEGTEEFLQDLLEPAFDSLIRGTKYEVNFADAAYSYLLGALSAGAMNSATGAAESVSERIDIGDHSWIDGYPTANGKDYFKGIQSDEALDKRYRKLSEQMYKDGNTGAMEVINRQYMSLKAFNEGERAAADNLQKLRELIDTLEQEEYADNEELEKTDAPDMAEPADAEAPTAPEEISAQTEPETAAQPEDFSQLVQQQLENSMQGIDNAPAQEQNITDIPAQAQEANAQIENNPLQDTQSGQNTIQEVTDNGGQQQQQTGTGNVLPYGDRGRLSDESTGEQAGQLAAGTEGAGRRSLEQSRTAAQRQNTANVLRLERTSAKELGISRGTDSRTLTVMPEASWDEAQRTNAARIQQETGKSVTYVLGPIQALDTTGQVVNARGVYSERGIVIQADHARLSIEQISDHEIFHDYAKNNPGLVYAAREAIREQFGAEQLDAAVDKYIRKMRGYIDVEEYAATGEAMTGEFGQEQYEEAMLRIAEEMCADAYAGINAYGANAAQFRDTVQSVMQERGVAPTAGRENAAATERTTAPPDSGELRGLRLGEAFEREQYSIDGRRKKKRINKNNKNNNLPLIGKQFPMYNVYGSDTNTQAIMWVNRKDVLVGQQHLLSHLGEYYVVVRSENADFGYYIKEKIDEAEYDECQERIRRYNREIQESQGERIVPDDVYADATASDRGERPDFDADIFEHGRETREIHKLGEKPLGRENVGYHGYGHSESGNLDIRRQEAAEVTDSDDKTRFSLDEDVESTDAEGNALTKQQQKYFKDSVVRDGDGKLLKVYHGSPAVFTEFSHDFLNTHGAAEGRGFYFTDSETMAEGYRKDGGQLLAGYLDIKKPLSTENVNLTANEVRELVREIDPTGDDLISNYDSLGGMGYPSQAWYDRALEDTVNTIMSGNDNDADILAELANAGGDNESVLTAARRLFGYDGYITKDKYDNANVYVAFESNQFKNTDNTNPTGAQDIRFSLDEDVEEVEPETRDAMEAVGAANLDEYAAVLEDIEQPENQAEDTQTDFQQEVQRQFTGEGVELDSQGKRIEEDMRRLGFDNIDDYTKHLTKQADEARLERLRSKTRDEFKGTESLKKHGVKIAGALGDYSQAQWLRGSNEAYNSVKREARKAENRLKATGSEKLTAKAIAEGTFTADDYPASVRPEVVDELVDWYSAEHSQGQGAFREVKAKINDGLDETMENIFAKADQYKSPASLFLEYRTPERSMRHIFKKDAPAIIEAIFDPVRANEAEKYRFINREFDRVRSFEGSDGKKKALNKQERELVQMQLEHVLTDFDPAGETDETVKKAAELLKDNATLKSVSKKFKLNDQQLSRAQEYGTWLRAKELSESKDIDKTRVENAVKVMQELYDDYYDMVSDFLAVHGFDGIGYIKGYAPHMQPEENKTAVAKAFQTLGLDLNVDNLPTSIAGLTADYKPNKRWNPHFQQRLGERTAYDAIAGFENYISYMADILYHTDDVMRIRAASRYFRRTFSSENISDQLSWARNMRAMNTTFDEKLDFLINSGFVKDGDYGSITERNIDSKIDEYVDSLYKQVEKTTAHGSLVTWLDNYANLMAGKQHLADRSPEYVLGRRSLNFGNSIIRAFSRSQVAGNMSSVLNQTAQLSDIINEIGPRYMTLAMKDMVAGAIQRDNWYLNSDFLTGKAGIKYLDTSAGDKLLEMMYAPAQAVDTLLSTLTVRGEYIKQLRKGKSEAEAMRLADLKGEHIMGSRMKGSAPTIFNSKNPVWRAVNLFAVENLNSFEHHTSDFAYDIQETIRTKGTAAGVARFAMKALSYLSLAFVMNRLADELYGGTPAPMDFGGMVMQALASGHEMETNEYIATLLDNGLEKLTGERAFGTDPEKPLEEFDTGAAIGEAGYNLMNDIPLLRNVSGVMGWGDNTLPMPDVGGSIRDIKKAVKGAGWLSTDTGREFAEALLQWAPGGRQLTKTMGGIETILRGGRYTGYGEDKKLQAPGVDDTGDFWQTVGQQIQAAVFGNNALRTQKEYYASDNDALSVNQTKLYDSLVKQGANKMELYDTIQKYREVSNDELSSYEKGAQQRALIGQTSLTDKQKLELYGGLTGAESRVEKFQAMYDAGLDWDKTVSVYDKYAELDQNEDLKATQKATQFAKWVDEQSMTKKQKDAAKEQFMFWQQIPAEAKSYEKYTSAGMSTSDAAKVTELTSGVEGNVAKMRNIVQSNLSKGAKTDAIGALIDPKGEMYTENGSLSAYGKFRNAMDSGLSVEDYVQLRESVSGDDTLSVNEKLRAAVSVGKTAQQQIEAVNVAGTYDSYYHKMTAAYNEYNVEPEDYVKFRELCEQYNDDNENINQSEAIEALNHMQWLNESQKAALFALQNTGWKSNPYSTSVGEAVVSEYKRLAESGEGAETESTASGSTPSASTTSSGDLSGMPSWISLPRFG